MNDFGTEFEQKGVIGGEILYIAMHALCNKKQSITFTGHLKYALDCTFFVPTHFVDLLTVIEHWELEFDMPQKSSIRQFVLININTFHEAAQKLFLFSICKFIIQFINCLLYTSPSPRDA